MFFIEATEKESFPLARTTLNKKKTTEICLRGRWGDNLELNLHKHES